MLNSVYPQSSETVDKQSLKQIAFADYLFQQKEFSMAAKEYHRIFFFSQNDSLTMNAHYKLGLSYMGLAQWNRARSIFSNVINESKNEDLKEAALYNQGACHSQAGDFTSARRQYDRIIASFPNGNLTVQSKMMRALTFVDEAQWVQAGAAFMQVSGDYPQTPAGLISGRMAIKSEQAARIPERSPLLAGLLSAILPGSGQALSGRIGDGFYSLVLTSTFGYLAYRLADEDKTASAAVCSVIGFSFYLGNIYGAQNTARRSYAQKIHNVQEAIRIEVINVL